MGYYPIFIKLDGLRVFLAGAGEVGRRKAASLSRAGAGDLLWVDPALSRADLAAMPLPDASRQCGRADFSTLLDAPGLRYEQREARESDIRGRALVFAATGDRAVNARLAAACREQGVLCNVIDAPINGPGEGNFIVPAHFFQDDILLALSTGGQSPALAKRLREDLQSWLGGRYGPLLELLGRLRPLLLELGGPSDGNREVFRALVNSDLAPLLASGNLEEARAVLARHLPEALLPRIGEILS